MQQRAILLVVIVGGAGLMGAVLGQVFRPRAPGELKRPAHWSESAPPMRVQTFDWSAGSHEPGHAVTKSYEIVNDTDVEWTFRHAMPSCTCVSATLSVKKLAPKATAKLDVVFRAPAKQGPANGSIMLEFFEPESQKYQINVGGMSYREPTGDKKP